MEILESAHEHGYTTTSVQVNLNKFKKILNNIFIKKNFKIKRNAILSALLHSLSDLANSTNATIYLELLNSTDCEILYPLFIEAK